MALRGLARLASLGAERLGAGALGANGKTFYFSRWVREGEREVMVKWGRFSN